MKKTLVILAAGIGSRFGVNFMTIAQWNHLGDPNLISVGQQLVIYPNVIR